MIPDDLRQSAVVVATLLDNTAMRDEMLPRPAQRQLPEEEHSGPTRGAPAGLYPAKEKI